MWSLGSIECINLETEEEDMIFVLRTRPLLLEISALQSQSWMEIRFWDKIGDDMLDHCDTESEGQVTRALTLFVQSQDHPIVTFSLNFHLVVTCHSFFCKITRKYHELKVDSMIFMFPFWENLWRWRCLRVVVREKHVDKTRTKYPSMLNLWTRCSPGKMNKHKGSGEV